MILVLLRSNLISLMVFFVDPYIAQINLWIAVNILGVTSHVFPIEVKASSNFTFFANTRKHFCFTFSEKGTHVIIASDGMEDN